MDALMADLGFRATHELQLPADHLDGFLRDILGAEGAAVTSRVHLCPPTTASPAHVLYTCGMSDRRQPEPSEGPAGEHELLLLLPRDWPFAGSAAPGPVIRGLDGARLGVVPALGSVAATSDPRANWANLWMHALAQLPHVTGRRLEAGNLVDAQGELPGTRFTAFFLLPMGDVGHATTDDGRTIDVLRVFPLFPEEVETKRAVGAATMIDLIMESEAHADLSPDRALVAAPASAGKPWWKLW